MHAGVAGYPRRLLYGTKGVVETHKKHRQEMQPSELPANQTKPYQGISQRGLVVYFIMEVSRLVGVMNDQIRLVATVSTL